jgi:protein-disulfide isomerase
LGIPVAIVIAAALIAGAIYLSGAKKTTSVNVQGGIDGAQKEQVTAEIVVAPITATDHIRGNPNAPIVIVEYSDYDCPFCRVFHDTMVKIMAKYGEGGKVAWVFRQFPLVQLHPDAPKIAIASECVAELEGNEAFWVFTDKLNASRKVEFTPDGNLKSVEPTNITRLAEFAVAAGADKTKFELCLNSGKFDEKIAADVEAAAKTGARGTPYSIVMVGDQQGVVNGAQPFEVVDKIVANLIAQLNGGTAQ